jgi:DNA-binding transcriptional LysR family regulator
MHSRHLFGHDLLRALVAIADAGSFAKAAKSLHLTQAAVSLQIRRLEEQTEQPLFERAGRNMVLTDAGRVLVEYARKIIALNLEATHALQGRRLDGTLRLGAPQDIAEDFLPEVLRQFAAAFPRVRLEVRIERNQQLVKSIQRGEFDVAVTLTEETFTLENEAIGTLQKIAQPKMQWLSAQRANPIEAGEALPLVLLEPPCIFRTHALAALETAGVKYRVAYSTASLSGLRAAVEAGLGFTARLASRNDEALGIAPCARRSAHVALPRLRSLQLILFRKKRAVAPAVDTLADLLLDALRRASP